MVSCWKENNNTGERFETEMACVMKDLHFDLNCKYVQTVVYAQVAQVASLGDDLEFSKLKPWKFFLNPIFCTFTRAKKTCFN